MIHGMILAMALSQSPCANGQCTIARVATAPLRAAVHFVAPSGKTVAGPCDGCTCAECSCAAGECSNQARRGPLKRLGARLFGKKGCR